MITDYVFIRCVLCVVSYRKIIHRHCVSYSWTQNVTVSDHTQTTAYLIPEPKM